MPTPEAALNAYLAEPKFADTAAWLARGLNPSSADAQARMEAAVDAVARSALAACQRGESAAATKRAIVRSLQAAKAIDFDTEEREWICAEVARVSKLVGISVGPELNSWLYGSVVGTLLRVSSLLRREPRSRATYSTPCESCSAELTSHVTAESPAIPDGGWIVCRCNMCSSLNLMRLGPGIKGSRSEGFKFVRQLRVEDFTQESAAAELAAMRRAESSRGSSSAP